MQGFDVQNRSGRGLAPARALSSPRSLALVAAALGLAVAGCGGDSGGSGGDGSSGGKVTIGFILTQAGVPTYETARLGALAGGKQEKDAKVIVQGPSNPTATATTTIVQNLLTSQRPDGFAANPCILDAWSRFLKTLPRDVPNGNVLAWNCKPTAAANDTSPIKTFVGVNDVQTGAAATEAAVKAAGLGPETTGTALVAKCAEGVPILDQRQAGALAVVKRMLPKVKAVELTTAPTLGPNASRWTSAFAKYTDVVLASGACDQDTGSLATFKTRGTGRDFAMGTIDPDARQLKLISQGKIDAGVATSPWVIANVATRLLIQGARGQSTPEGWVDTKIQEITKANANKWLEATTSPAAAQRFFGPAADKILAGAKTSAQPLAAAYKE